MSFTANALVRSLQGLIPSLAARGAMNPFMMTITGGTLIAAGSLTLLPTIIVTAVNILGFTTGGVLSGSIAAFLQSLIFGGQTAGWFSVLQAFGATAAIQSPIVISIGSAMAVVGAGLQNIGGFF